jgi:hypothetical protein
MRGEGNGLEHSKRVIEGHKTIEMEWERRGMSAIEGNLRAIESRNDMVNCSVARCVARSQSESQSHLRVGVHQVVSILSVAQQGAYQRSRSLHMCWFLITSSRHSSVIGLQK